MSGFQCWVGLSESQTVWRGVWTCYPYPGSPTPTGPDPSSLYILLLNIPSEHLIKCVIYLENLILNCIKGKLDLTSLKASKKRRRDKKFQTLCRICGVFILEHNIYIAQSIHETLHNQRAWLFSGLFQAYNRLKDKLWTTCKRTVIIKTQVCMRFIWYYLTKQNNV